MIGEENISTKTVDVLLGKNLPSVGEVRVVDPVTGGEKGSKLQRFSLIPYIFLWALAEHYGKGAHKYTKRLPISSAYDIIGKLCTCTMKSDYAVNVADLNQAVSPKMATVDPATNSAYVAPTSNMPNDSATTPANGWRSTETPIENANVFQPANHDLRHSDSPSKMKQNLSQMDVRFAEMGRMDDGSILITTIKPGNSERSCAEPVTKGLVTSEMIQNDLKKHDSTCKILQQIQVSKNEIIVSGDRNWERGYKWSLSLDAAHRHINQWLRGEDNDAETNSNHLIAAIWHLIALYCYSMWKRGTDDLRT